MERFGFTLLSDSECKELGLPRSIGSFEDLFNEMTNEVQRNKKIEKRTIFI